MKISSAESEKEGVGGDNDNDGIDGEEDGVDTAEGSVSLFVAVHRRPSLFPHDHHHHSSLHSLTSYPSPDEEKKKKERSVLQLAYPWRRRGGGVMNEGMATI